MIQRMVVLETLDVCVNEARAVTMFLFLQDKGQWSHEGLLTDYYSRMVDVQILDWSFEVTQKVQHSRPNMRKLRLWEPWFSKTAVTWNLESWNVVYNTLETIKHSVNREENKTTDWGKSTPEWLLGKQVSVRIDVFTSSAWIESGFISTDPWSRVEISRCHEQKWTQSFTASWEEEAFSTPTKEYHHKHGILYNSEHIGLNAETETQ